MNFRFIKSPVWHGKSPVTGHEPDSKNYLVCEPDLVFVTHLYKWQKVFILVIPKSSKNSHYRVSTAEKPGTWLYWNDVSQDHYFFARILTFYAKWRNLAHVLKCIEIIENNLLSDFWTRMKIIFLFLGHFLFLNEIITFFIM